MKVFKRIAIYAMLEKPHRVALVTGATITILYLCFDFEELRVPGNIIIAN